MNAIDLFAGCGGLSLGLSKAKINVVAAYDSWQKAVDIYNQNLKHPAYVLDLSNQDEIIERLKDHKVDLIAGGPPCQDFSQAGKRNEGDRASLTQNFANIIASKLPEWYLMENVARAQKSSSYSFAKDVLKAAGYGITEMVLDASLTGVPQKRKRFFSIGHLHSEDNFLLQALQSKLSTKPTTVRDYLKGDIDIDHYYRHPRNYSRRGVFSIDEPAPTVRGVNRPVPKGYPGHHGDTENIKTSKTIRPLTTIERGRLQTFPKNFKWGGTKTDLEQMIGNAVPVDLAKYVGKAISEYDQRFKQASLFSDTLDDEAFNLWMKEIKGYKQRSTRDVISRYRRAIKLVSEIQSVSDPAEAVYVLSRSTEYNQLSTSVKSQLKKSLNIVGEYKNSHCNQ